jgi:hypothetical protein
VTKIRTAEEHLAHLEGLYVKLVQADGDPEEIDTLRQLIAGHRSNGVENPDRPTPETVISRVMRDHFGLARDQFRVQGYHERRDGRRVKVGVRLVTWSMDHEHLIARNAEMIERITWGMGHGFQVKVDWTRSGQPLTYVSHACDSEIRKELDR